MQERARRSMMRALMSTVALGVVPSWAWAQQAQVQTASQVEEVVVTARKRVETVQKVPATVAVVSAERLVASGAATLTDLPTLASGVNMTSSPNSNEYGVTIRGLGSSPGNASFDSSVSLFVDGVYAPRNREFAAAMFDVERIEVIRGTQAALLGKNTSLGAINLLTKKPGTQFAYDLRVAHEFEVGGDLFSGGVDLPISDTVAVRLSGQASDTDGPVRDVVSGQNAVRLTDRALRGVVTWKPDDRLDATLVAQRDQLENRGSAAEFIATNGQPELLQALAGAPGTIDTKLDYRNAVSTPANGGEQSGKLVSDRVSGTVNYALGDYVVTAISGYSRMVSNANDDFDFQVGDYLFGSTREVGTQYSQEVRLASPAERRFSYLVGALYLKSELDYRSSRTANYPFGPAPGVNIAGAFSQPFDQHTKAASVFGNTIFKLTDRLQSQVGLRWTTETKDVDLARIITTPGFFSTVLYPAYAPFSMSNTERSLDYSVGLKYDFSPQANVYVSYGQGTKGGGFANSVTYLDQSAYRKEVAHTAEAGVKLQAADRRWTFNLAAFDTRVDDFQLVSFTGLSFDIGNTDLKSRGLELESYWVPARGLRLFLNATYADAEDLHTGRVPPMAPKLSGSLGFSYSHPVSQDLELRLDGGVDHRSKRYYQQSPDTSPQGEAFTTLNASVALASPGQGWELRVIGRNLTDENQLSFAFPAPILSTGNQLGISERPRTISLQLSIRR